MKSSKIEPTKKCKIISFSQRLCLLSTGFILILLSVKTSLAVPEDRGAMGGVYALSAGAFVATGEDQEAERLSSQYGYSVGVFLGEEVMPKLFVGLHLNAHLDSFKSGNEPSQSQLFAFGLEGRYRLTGESRGLLVLAGLGIGAGGFIGNNESLTKAEASSGGSIWKLGLAYELGGEKVEGFSYLPYLLLQRLGAQMESQVSMNVMSLGLEVLYAGGR